VRFFRAAVADDHAGADVVAGERDDAVPLVVLGPRRRRAAAGEALEPLLDLLPVRRAGTVEEARPREARDGDLGIVAAVAVSA
jgi:hypothetical protein